MALQTWDETAESRESREAAEAATPLARACVMVLAALVAVGAAVEILRPVYNAIRYFMG